MTYKADVIPGLLPEGGSLLIVGRAGRSSIAAYAATAISQGKMFFSLQTQKRPVLLFNSDHGDRRIDARKVLEDVAEYGGLHVACAGCSDKVAIGERITDTMTTAFEEADDGNFRAVHIYDDLAQAFQKPSDAHVAANVIEAATWMITNSADFDLPLIVMLDALPADVLDGVLRPLGSMFDVVAHIDLIGDGAWGRLSVVKSRVGATGMFCDFTIDPVEIGTDDAGRSVRAPAISPHIATMRQSVFAD